jgi:elongation factor P
MSIKASNLRRGMGVEYQNGVFVVHSSTHVAHGKGQSYMQIELKNARTGQILKNRFRVDENFEEIFLDRKPMEYLYSDGTNFIVMDPESFEQTELPAEMIGNDAVYLTENVQLQISFVDGVPVSVELPNTVILEVVQTPPQVKGATATNQLKDALCEGGAKVRVPPFVENGTKIKVDTRTGEYIGRA